MTPGSGIEPGTHWWEASALTTVPSLLPALEEASLGVESNKLMLTIAPPKYTSIKTWQPLEICWACCCESLAINVSSVQELAH